MLFEMNLASQTADEQPMCHGWGGNGRYEIYAAERFCLINFLAHFLDIFLHDVFLLAQGTTYFCFEKKVALCVASMFSILCIEIGSLGRRFRCLSSNQNLIQGNDHVLVMNELGRIYFVLVWIIQDYTNNAYTYFWDKPCLHFFRVYLTVL